MSRAYRCIAITEGATTKRFTVGKVYPVLRRVAHCDVIGGDLPKLQHFLLPADPKFIVQNEPRPGHSMCIPMYAHFEVIEGEPA